MARWQVASAEGATTGSLSRDGTPDLAGAKMSVPLPADARIEVLVLDSRTYVTKERRSGTSGPAVARL